MKIRRNNKKHGIPALLISAVMILCGCAGGNNPDETSGSSKGEDSASMTYETVDTTYVYENLPVIPETVFPQREIIVADAQATYLMWVNISRFAKDSRDFCGFLRRETGLFITPGATYGTGGEGFVRINVACPREYVRDGMERFVRGAKKYTSLNE